jgi:hypothetical protein
MCEQVINPFGLPEAIRRAFAVLGLHVINRPIAKVFAIKNQQVSIHRKFNLFTRKTEVFTCISLVFKLDLNVECISRVTPAQWPDSWSIKTPVVHRLIRIMAAMKQSEVQTRLFWLESILRHGGLGSFKV